MIKLLCVIKKKNPSLSFSHLFFHFLTFLSINKPLLTIKILYAQKQFLAQKLCYLTYFILLYTQFTITDKNQAWRLPKRTRFFWLNTGHCLYWCKLHRKSTPYFLELSKHYRYLISCIHVCNNINTQLYKCGIKIF